VNGVNVNILVWVLIFWMQTSSKEKMYPEGFRSVVVIVKQQKTRVPCQAGPEGSSWCRSRRESVGRAGSKTTACTEFAQDDPLQAQPTGSGRNTGLLNDTI
jgi:hypothetical protein